MKLCQKTTCQFFYKKQFSRLLEIIQVVGQACSYFSRRVHRYRECYWFRRCCYSYACHNSLRHGVTSKYRYFFMSINVNNPLLRYHLFFSFSVKKRVKYIHKTHMWGYGFKGGIILFRTRQHKSEGSIWRGRSWNFEILIFDHS